MTKLDNFSKEVLEDIVTHSNSMAEVISILGYANRSGDLYQKLNQRLDELNIDRSHFKKVKPVKRTIENIFIEHSTADQKTLRKYYTEGQYTDYKCAICSQLPVWNNKPMTLILDHINGVNNDDRLENLRWVCPNCDSQLSTSKGKNIPRLKILVQD